MRTRPYAPVLLLLASVLLTGCGPFGSSSGSQPTTPAAVTTTTATPPLTSPAAHKALLAAAAKVQGAGSAAVDGTVVTQPVGTGAALTLRFAGKERWAPSEAGSFTVTGAKVAGNTVGKVTMLITPGALYLKVPGLATVLHKPWAKLSLAGSSSVAGKVGLGVFSGQAEQLQPGRYLELLAQSANLKPVGTATIDGIKTRHYAGSVDLRQELAGVPGVPAVWSQLASAQGLKAAHLNAWLDAKNRPRRITLSVGSSALTTTVTLHLSSYGMKVAVTPPASSATVDLTKGLLGALG